MAAATEMALVEAVMVMAVVAEPEGHQLAALDAARVVEGLAEVVREAVDTEVVGLVAVVLVVGAKEVAAQAAVEAALVAVA